MDTFNSSQQHFHMFENISRGFLIPLRGISLEVGNSFKDGVGERRSKEL